MATADQYILSFDFNEIVRQISTLSAAYEELGKTFQRTMDNSEKSLAIFEARVVETDKVLQESMQKATSFYATLFGNMDRTVKMFESLSKHSESISKNIGSLGKANLNNLVAQSTATGMESGVSASKPFMSMSLGINAEDSGMASDALARAEKAIQMAKKAVDEVKASEAKVQDSVKSLWSKVKDEMKAGKDKVTGILSSSSMGILGSGMVGGIIGAILLGAKEKDRVRAEAGEMKNAFEPMGDLFEKGTSKARSYFAGFAEDAQFFFGIGRKEIQGLVKQLADAGYVSDDFFDKQKKHTREVTDNVLNLTLGIDKALNFSSGDSMKNVIKITQDYGDSLDEAADKYKRLAFAAQASGMGINKFIDSVMAGSGSLVQYGIDMEDVAQVTEKLYGYYKGMGLSEKKAGAMAAEGTTGIMGGLAGMDEGMKAILGQRIAQRKDGTTLGALEAKQYLQEGAARVAKGEDKDFLNMFMSELKKFTVEQMGTSRAGGVEFLMQKGGMNQQTASAFYDMAGNIENGYKIQELGTEQTKNLLKAFEIEGEQVSDLQKTQRELIRGLAGIGEGLIKIIGSLIGTLVVGMKSIFGAIYGLGLYGSGEFEKADKLFEDMWQMLKQQSAGFGEGVDQVVDGAVLTGKVIGGAIADAAKNIKAAAEYDPGGSIGGIIKRLKESKAFYGVIGEVVSEKLKAYMDSQQTDRAYIKVLVESLWDKLTGREAYDQKRLSDVPQASQSSARAASPGTRTMPTMAKSDRKVAPVRAVVSGSKLNQSLKLSTSVP